MLFSKANGLNSTIYGKSQDPIRMFLQEEEQVYKKASKIEDIFLTIESKRYGEKFSQMTAKGNFQDVGEGGAYPRTSQQVGYEKFIEPDEWKNSFEVTETIIEDAQMIDVKGMASDFMWSYYRTREQFAANFLNFGANSTFTFQGKTYTNTCADGQALFSDTHPSIVGGAAQSNKSTLVFSYDNLLAVESKMQNFTNDNGHMLNIQPDTIVIPNEPAIKDLVAQVVWTGQGKPGTTNHSYNINESRWNVVVWNQLKKAQGATNDPWFLVDSRRNKMVGGLIWVNRVPLRVRSWLDDNTGNNIWGGRSRFGAGIFDWRAWFGNYPA